MTYSTNFRNRLALPLAMLMLLLLQACATHNTVRDGDDAALMLEGKDPVAYFTLGKAVAGRPEIKAEHEGVTYRFMNTEHRELFARNPQKFAPQYNGFCSNGAVYGIPLASQTGAFKIVDGRLFMFGGAGSKKYWEMDEKGNIERGDYYWRTEMQGKPARLQAWKRLVFRVPHYKTNRELAVEWEARHARKQ
jgi:YHS domain-containing protein